MLALSSKLYVDLTTAFDERGRIAHGTVRVERELVGALADLGSADTVFCRFDRASGRFVEIAAADAVAIVRAPTVVEVRRAPRPAWRQHPLLAAGRRLEKWFRTNIRDRFRRRRRVIVQQVAPPPDIFAPGSVLLLPGELQRQDFGVLMELRRRLDLRLAFVFYDLLGTLAADDPRAQDPNATDVPSTEFIMREASLILPISAYSAGELARHAAARGVTLPAVSVIRLGHRIAAAGAAATPVPDLVPGRFCISVGDVVPRKNHALLIDIWTELARERGGAIAPLLIVGRIGADGTPIAAAVDPVAAGVVRFLSNADDATLRWLYVNCRFTLFPSWSEGFGLPVVESLASAKPCIASAATSIPEASQGTAIHLDPADRTAWRDAIVRLLDDDAALARHTADIRARFQLVGWHDTADDVLRALAPMRTPRAR